MKKRFLLSLCAALIVPGILLSGCGSSSIADSAAVEESAAGEDASDDDSTTGEDLADESSGEGESEETASSRSGRSSLADKLARAAQETDEDDNENDDEERDASSVNEDEEDVSERESADDDADDEEDEWSLAEYTYYLGIKDEYEWVDSDDGDGILMNLLLQYLEIEPQYDKYGEELSVRTTSL